MEKGGGGGDDDDLAGDEWFRQLANDIDALEDLVADEVQGKAGFLLDELHSNSPSSVDPEAVARVQASKRRMGAQSLTKAEAAARHQEQVAKRAKSASSGKSFATAAKTGQGRSLAASGKKPVPPELAALADVRSTMSNSTVLERFVNKMVQPAVAGPLGVYIMLESDSARTNADFVPSLKKALRQKSLASKNKSLSRFRRDIIQKDTAGTGRLAFTQEEVGYLLYQAACIYGQPKSKFFQVRTGSTVSYDEQETQKLQDARTGAEKLVGRPPWARLIQLAWYGTERQRDSMATFVVFDDVVKRLIDVCHVQTWNSGFRPKDDPSAQKLHTWQWVIEETHDVLQDAMEKDDIVFRALAHLALADALVGYLQDVKADGRNVMQDVRFRALLTLVGAGDDGLLPDFIYGSLSWKPGNEFIMLQCIIEQLQVLSQRISALSEKEVRVDGGGGAEDLEAEFRLRLRFR